jgi:hypothetical protein
MFNVKVNFAHGISHIFRMDKEYADEFADWVYSGMLNGIKTDYVECFRVNNKYYPNYVLNRDYICSVKISRSINPFRRKYIFS